jgi:hypothetical protein
MKNWQIASGVLAAVALSACASTPPATGTRAATAHNAPAVSCVATPTGQLAPPRDCAGWGHTWTQQDIDRSGAATTSDALRLLDPTITVHQ